MKKTSKQQLREQFHKEKGLEHSRVIVSYAAWLEDTIIESNIIQIES
jgi:hypothetical protein